ncbi:hypothetical protein [Lacticaseibacillus sp. N501-2]|uniref:hypothetical protein n=1 Tax=Lacticaseibacillus salsurae TaxID=3367729 RepID=UPI0038B32D49
MGIQTVVPWYTQTWWIGTKEVLILLGFLVAAFTYRRNTIVRAQDVKANQIQRTFDLMQQYPGETRKLVLKVTRELNDVFNAVEQLKLQHADAEEVKQARAKWVEAVDLITLLHFLDPWGFLLSHPEHLYKSEAINTFASELVRVLLDTRLATDIDQIMEISSMKGIPKLIELLEVYEIESTKEE